ncbi:MULTISPECIES: anti-sigma factor family protein [unclassified Streptomyces]|uniref:anti-sigma factor family protein n=1 Tax=unclassified Streptomyces TaxID=2593676 RepID=UPI0037F639A4
MSGTRPTPAEQHLGDRLSALVDGELSHDARERVLAHVATCPKCKTEVDAQRRLKNVFAEVAPPAPSESFLARLQGLPGGGGADDDRMPPLGGFGTGVGLSGFPGLPDGLGGRRDEPFEFGYVPARDHGSVLTPATERGFRIHPVGRSDAERSRSMRLAFVAAGAVSLAAIALGGITTGAPTDTDARGSGVGSNVTPARSPGTGAVAASDSQRRRSTGPLLSQGGQLGETPAAPTRAAAPLLPGIPAPVAVHPLHRLAAPMLAGAAAMSPLIRPLSTTPPVSLTAWGTTAPGAQALPTSASPPRDAR